MIEKEEQEKPGKSTMQKPVRLWPGILAVALQWLVRYVIPIVIPEAMAPGVFGGVIFGVVTLIWWAFFSRAPRLERWSAGALMVISLVATSFIIDKSIATAMVGLMFAVYSIPVMCLAFVVWATAARWLPVKYRMISMILTILFASGVWIVLRTDGMDGDGHHDFNWRWAKTHEERLMVQAAKEPEPVTSEVIKTDTSIEWPGFRGPGRDGIVRGLKIATDWGVSPPVELWRRQVGPGCSSFAIRGDLVYTQEQRGDYEVVTCYSLTSGKRVWEHKDKARFWDSHAGAGPRSTPTLSGHRIYTLGATGILNSLDVTDGKAFWTRNAASDAGVKVLSWGFTSSPLVVGDLVIVALAGKLAAFDTVDGKPRWFGPDGGGGYSSPQLFSADSTVQVLLMSKAGAVSLSPDNGKVIWTYPWPTDDRILQPALIGKNDLLLSADLLQGIRRISLIRETTSWKIKERWNSVEMKTFFNDMVIHKDYVYGFDGPSIACVDLANGKRKWKGDRYRGWLLLLTDQELLLVLTERGELALVKADPSRFRELSRIKAISGKTWNHPALAGDILVVRNSVEMAAFRLPTEGGRKLKTIKTNISNENTDNHQ